MFGVLLYDILFFGIPAIILVLFIISIVRYATAKSKNKKMPGYYSDGEIRKRKIMLITMIVLAVIVGVMAIIVIGVIALLFTAVAYM